ncbi:MAG: hypothetical protein HQL37_02490 [Alphaproteobacteria bacterium]|nr:hypothetical protein [Alphaproteobacteria bacterium]
MGYLGSYHVTKWRCLDAASNWKTRITVVPAAKIGGVIGEADDTLLLRVNLVLVLFLGIV